MRTTFYLMRHAEADYTRPNTWQTKGWGYDLAPLSVQGRMQAKAMVAQVKAIAPDIMLCSPTTRAMETAMHLMEKLSMPFQVEFDIHEWVPDLTFDWQGLRDVQRIERDFNTKEGIYSADRSEQWESFEMMRERMQRTLRRYTHHEKVLVVCHGMVMRSLTGQEAIGNTEIIAYRLTA